MYLDPRFKTHKEQRLFLLKVRKECDKSLIAFTQFFFKELTGNKFIRNNHQDVICGKLQELDKYKLELLNINIPPRFSKTELAAVNFISRGIGMNPNASYLYITASDELRSQTSVAIRNIVTHPFFKIMYGVELRKDQNSKSTWRTVQGGGLKTATIFGQITGFGAGIMKETVEEIRNFEGCIVLDDINKIDDSDTENAINDKVTRVVFNTVLSRRNSKDTPIINIQQRAGLSDITAEFMDHYGLENPKAEFLIMPVISKEGVPLWEWKHDLKAIEVLRTSPRTAHVFETQYMQNPIPKEGVVFVKDEMNWFNYNDLNLEYIESKLGNIDVADQGEDYLSFPSGVLIGDKFYITDWLFTNEPSEITRPKVASIINTNKINHIGIEANNMGFEYYKALDREVNSFSTIYPKHSSKSKVSRIINTSEFVKKHFVFRSDVVYNSDYDKALRHFFRFLKNGKYKKDDAPDSIAGLVILIQDIFYDKFY